MIRKDWESAFLDNFRKDKVHTMGNSMSIGYLLQNWSLIVTNIYMDVPNFSTGRCLEKKKKTCLNKIKLFCLNYNVCNR